MSDWISIPMLTREITPGLSLIGTAGSWPVERIILEVTISIA
jgi:hypothetical protein